MYELVIKILGETDYKKYTIEELEEMKQILLDLKTEEVRLRRINNVRTLGEEKTDRGKGKSL
jgi:hypothetical protein